MKKVWLWIVITAVSYTHLDVYKRQAPSYMRHVCSGCGYEYDQMLGDVENDIAAGTSFEKLPEEWVCPECGEDKTQFIETLD